MNMGTDIPSLANGWCDCLANDLPSYVHYIHKSEPGPREEGEEVAPPRQYSQLEAERFAKEQARLSAERKAILVLDLDHTLAHCTRNKENAGNAPSFTIGDELWFYHFRPGLTSFIQQLQPLFEIHMYTFATRPYAEHLTNAISGMVPDPRTVRFRTLFTRNECIDKKRKSVREMFPNSRNVLVVDDNKGDVWLENEQLLRVPPFYHFGKKAKRSPNDQHLYTLLSFLKKFHSIYFDYGNCDTGHLLGKIREMSKRLCPLSVLAIQQEVETKRKKDIEKKRRKEERLRRQQQQALLLPNGAPKPGFVLTRDQWPQALSLMSDMQLPNNNGSCNGGTTTISSSTNVQMSANTLVITGGGQHPLGGVLPSANNNTTTTLFGTQQQQSQQFTVTNNNHTNTTSLQLSNSTSATMLTMHHQHQQQQPTLMNTDDTKGSATTSPPTTPSASNGVSNSQSTTNIANTMLPPQSPRSVGSNNSAMNVDCPPPKSATKTNGAAIPSNTNSNNAALPDRGGSTTSSAPSSPTSSPHTHGLTHSFSQQFNTGTVVTTGGSGATGRPPMPPPGTSFTPNYQQHQHQHHSHPQAAMKLLAQAHRAAFHHQHHLGGTSPTQQQQQTNSPMSQQPAGAGAVGQQQQQQNFNFGGPNFLQQGLTTSSQPPNSARQQHPQSQLFNLMDRPSTAPMPLNLQQGHHGANNGPGTSSGPSKSASSSMLQHPYNGHHNQMPSSPTSAQSYHLLGQQQQDTHPTHSQSAHAQLMMMGLSVAGKQMNLTKQANGSLPPPLTRLPHHNNAPANTNGTSPSHHPSSPTRQSQPTSQATRKPPPLPTAATEQL
eukprot:TRINITY_DN55308_c0_g1_i1.p1 TRINITY_DN55308_c0_g1~~TRINITY_DN55308_c0_g1_i1.p1  ORF type:complete len:847 (+),score=118.78 TRINITY_DN55308_c0_g1_i1:58-2541(+)